MFFGYKKYQKWGCHGQKSEFFSNAHIYSPRQDFLVSFIFSISGFVWLESRLIDFGGGDECIPLVCLAHTGRGARTLSPKDTHARPDGFVVGFLGRCRPAELGNT